MRETLRNKLLSLMLVVSMCLSLLPVYAAEQSDEIVYLALGDSITAGDRLDDATKEAFPTLFAEGIEAASFTNAGISRQTAAGLLEALEAGEYDDDVKGADVITITIGGNDLMAYFYDFLAEIYNDANSTSLTGEDIKGILADPTASANLMTALALFNLINDTDWSGSLVVEVDENTESTGFMKAADDCAAAVLSIVEYIGSINSDTVILVANQYNPYQWLDTDYSNIISLFETGVGYFNTQLSEQLSEYTVVDIAGEFAKSEDTLTNAEVDMTSLTSMKVDFDFHPNSVGHQTIAAAMAEAYNTVTGSTGEGEPEPGTETEIETETETETEIQTKSETESELQTETPSSDTVSTETPSSGTGSTEAPHSQTGTTEAPSATVQTQTVAVGTTFDDGDYYYKVTSVEKQTAQITGLKNNSLKKLKLYMNVKLEGETYKVTSIAKNAFKGNKKITSVTIPKTYLTIGTGAFSGCTSLKKVSVNSTSLKSIGAKAFYNCKKLTSIVLKSKSLKKVGKQAVKGVNKKCVITVKKSKESAYAKLFRGKGGAVVKGK